MGAAEGQFPKVDGDILYGSEVNNFNDADLRTKNIINQQSEQNINILINSAASSSTLNDYDDMYLDVFSDSNGYLNTINTSNAYFNTDKYEFIELELEGTTQNSTTVTSIGTYSSGPISSTYTAVTDLIITALRVDTNSNSDSIIIEIIQNSDIIATKTVSSSSSATTYTLSLSDYSRPILAGQTFTVKYDPTGSAQSQYETGITFTGALFNSLNGIAPGEDGASSTYCSASKVNILSENNIETNAETITANPTAHQVYCHNSLGGTGTLTYDISFDNGSTWIIDQELNIKNTSVHDGTEMIFKLNLNALDNNDTIEVSDYAIMLYY